MPHNRFFVSTELAPNQSISLDGEEAHHLTVMRLRAGESVELVNGQGVLATAEITNSSKKMVSLLVTNTTIESVRKPKLRLFQALPKVNRLDYIVEKATELGVDEIVLFPGDKSEKKSLSDQQQVRLNHLAISALKQCGRLTLPHIVYANSINEESQFSGLKLFGDIGENAKPLLTLLPELKDETEITFCIGPEAGFSDKETEFLLTQGFQGVSLHYNILRTETAPLVALALLSQLKHIR